MIELNRQALTDYKGLPNSRFPFVLWHELAHIKLGHPAALGETPENRLDTAEAVGIDQKTASNQIALLGILEELPNLLKVTAIRQY